MSADRSHLVPMRVIDRNGRPTTVHVSPADRGRLAAAGPLTVPPPSASENPDAEHGGVHYRPPGLVRRADPHEFHGDAVPRGYAGIFDTADHATFDSVRPERAAAWDAEERAEMPATAWVTTPRGLARVTHEADRGARLLHEEPAGAADDLDLGELGDTLDGWTETEEWASADARSWSAAWSRMPGDEELVVRGGPDIRTGPLGLTLRVDPLSAVDLHLVERDGGVRAFLTRVGEDGGRGLGGDAIRLREGTPVVSDLAGTRADVPLHSAGNRATLTTHQLPSRTPADDVVAAIPEETDPLYVTRDGRDTVGVLLQTAHQYSAVRDWLDARLR